LRPDLADKVTQYKIFKKDISVEDQCLGKGYFEIVHKGQKKTENGSLKTVAIKGFKGKSYKNLEMRIIFVFFNYNENSENYLKCYAYSCTHCKS